MANAEDKSSPKGQGISPASDAAAKPQVVATWLSKTLLLAVGAPGVDPGATKATLFAGDESLEIGVRCMPIEAANGAERRKILTAVVGDGSKAAQGARLAMGGIEANGSPAVIRLTDLTSILNDHLSGLGDGVARQVIEFISGAPAAHGLAGERDLVLSSKLHIVRNSLRRRLPTVAIEPDQALSGNIDTLVPIDESTFFVKGWIRDGEAPIIRLTAITPEGERVELLDICHRVELPFFEVYANGPYSQPVDAGWFLALFTTTTPSRLRKGWVFEIQNETGHAVEMYALPEVAEVHSARTSVLRSIPEGALPDDELMSRYIFPAIDQLQARAREAVKIESADNYGGLAAAPDISIIVPLYKRIDFVEHQLLQFSRDPELQTQELIYVLDSPEWKTELADRARQLTRLYQIPFRVVTMADNVGFGAATHAGISIARGRLLLLLNPDVLPAEQGWLGRMQAFYDSTPDIGALGPKLMYEDDSLQHAGLYFDVMQEGPTAGSWANVHYFKGLHKDLPAANIARPVPALTAACLMIEQDLYYKAGGLPDVYVQGDYEDSELCMRLLAEGRENWYLPAVELYHLEGSSYPDAEREITGTYNRWLQTRRIGQEIEDAMARYPRI